MIAVVLHIYYTEMWEHYKNKLQSLDTKFDLYITLCDEVEDISKDILKSFPTANIKKYKNRGQDIGPFLLTLKDIRHKDYDYLIKLHTKGFASVDYSKRKKKKFRDIKNWRKALTNALISSDDKIKENISILTDSEYKMCGCKQWHLKRKSRVYSKFSDHEELVYEFIGGTMFMVDFKFFKEIWTDEIIDEYYSQMPTAYKVDHSFTHYAERQLGQCVIDVGFKIKGV